MENFVEKLDIKTLILLIKTKRAHIAFFIPFLAIKIGDFSPDTISIKDFDVRVAQNLYESFVKEEC